MAEDLKLLRSWSSLYGVRVVQALKIKAIEYETVLEDLTNKSASLLEYNPVHKKIPVLVHDGKPICESLVILEYIDDTWKQHPLLPRDPWDRAMARFWAKFGDEKKLLTLDIAFGWMAMLISILEEIAELTLLDAEIFPLLSAWMNNFSDDPTIKESWPPRERMVEKFKVMRQPYLSKVV